MTNTWPIPTTPRGMSRTTCITWYECRTWMTNIAFVVWNSATWLFERRTPKNHSRWITATKNWETPDIYLQSRSAWAGRHALRAVHVESGWRRSRSGSAVQAQASCHVGGQETAKKPNVLTLRTGCGIGRSILTWNDVVFWNNARSLRWLAWSPNLWCFKHSGQLSNNTGVINKLYVIHMCRIYLWHHGKEIVLFAVGLRFSTSPWIQQSAGLTKHWDELTRDASEVLPVELISAKKKRGSKETETQYSSKESYRRSLRLKAI